MKWNKKLPRHFKHYLQIISFIYIFFKGTYSQRNIFLTYYSIANNFLYVGFLFKKGYKNFVPNSVVYFYSISCLHFKLRNTQWRYEWSFLSHDQRKGVEGGCKNIFVSSNQKRGQGKGIFQKLPFNNQDSEENIR